MASPDSPPQLPRELIDAIVSVGSELSLDAVLRRIVTAATELVDAAYGALGVLAPSSLEHLSQFITVGLSDDEIAEIGKLPTGRGVLGLVIKQPVPLLLENLADSRASVGFPPNHPPMRTFLGVPIRVRDEVYGNLYLTDKRSGRFTEDDERVVVALAAAAGMAIANARLHEAGILREQWLAAATAMTTELVSLPGDRSPLEIIGAHLRDVAPNGQAFATARDEAEVVVDSEANPGIRIVSTEIPRDGAPDAVIGLVLSPDRTAADIGTVTTQLRRFAAQAALALRVADSRAMAERVATSEDRDRIARDLHDLVIQRLFASGMALESTIRLVDSPVASERIHRVVDELDTTIREIRSAIYSLQNPTEGTGSVGIRARALAVIQATDGLAVAPNVHFDGPLDDLVSDVLAGQVEAVLIEGLSNAARHAQASTVDVFLTAADGELRVVILDDGVGILEGGRRSGLANLRARASELGGTCEATAVPSGGTQLSWTVPLEQRESTASLN